MRLFALGRLDAAAVASEGGAMIATYVIDTAGIARPWPREAPVDHLLGVPISRCKRCGVSFVTNIPLCPWCGKARMAVARAGCRAGHAVIGANVYLHPNGYRRCRICCLARWARYNREGRYRGHRRIAVRAGQGPESVGEGRYRGAS